MGRYHYVFPEWTNLALPAALIVGPIVPLYIIFVVAYGFSPDALWVGYEPEQPIPFSHKLHAGELGIDCRYCHTTVEHAAHASVPPTQTCMSCHVQIHPESPQLRPLWRSYETGEPVQWVKVHDVADYVYFDHSVHVNAGVSCVECHGRVDRMEVVYQAEPLSMAWCLDCHRNPVGRVRDPKLVTDLGWQFEGTLDEHHQYSREWIELHHLQPTQDCSACHR
jgi:menaquinone reductase, multiheme cytochrome c subunit